MDCFDENNSQTISSGFCYGNYSRQQPGPWFNSFSRNEGTPSSRLFGWVQDRRSAQV
jgi:hypothetical protein